MPSLHVLFSCKHVKALNRPYGPCRRKAECVTVPTSEPEDTDQARAAAEQKSTGSFRPVVLILVGVPGAGKSTFSAAVQAASPGMWQRVNQVKAAQSLYLPAEARSHRETTQAS